MVLRRVASVVLLFLLGSIEGQYDLPECTMAGYYRVPGDCTRFYRCVDITAGAAGIYKVGIFIATANL